MGGTLALRLFGPPRITWDRGSVPFARERPFQLLAYLAARGDWVTRDELAELFYPERDTASARSNLRKVLHNARAFDWARDLETRGELVRWSIASDLRGFEQALAERRTADVVDAYAGAFALGLDDESCPAFTAWIEFERTRRATQWHGAAVESLRGLDPAAALALTERLLQTDPYDDEALRARLGALDALGRGREAQRAYREYAERLAEELGVEPNAATRAAAARVAEAREIDRPDAPRATRDLFGRENELDEVARLLAESDKRLITIAGIGGVGKTRLARAVFARAAAGRFRGGAFWVEAEGLDSVEPALARLADAMGLALRSGDVCAQITAALRDRTALVVFDNCEHLVAPVSGQGIEGGIELLVARCPRIIVLVTSRVRLRLAHERLVLLGGLTYADAQADPAAVLAQPAAQLFAARARSVLPDFDANVDAAAIGSICRLVEGLPLALELAAAWARVLPCHEIAADLQARLEVMEATALGGRGLRAAFERSWQLAAPAERDALARLSVICGSFTREAARAIARASLPVLAGLVDKSLLDADRDRGRFGLHPLVRALAAEKLAALPGGEAQAHADHAAFFRQHVARFREFERIDQRQALAEIGREIENAAAAWRWACAQRDADFVAAVTPILRRYFENKGLREEGLRWFNAAESALKALDRRAWPARCELGAAIAILLRQNGDCVGAEAKSRRTLPLARTLGRRSTIKACLNTIGTCAWLRGRVDEAERYLRAGLRMAQQERDAVDIAVFSNNLGIVECLRGDATAAEGHYRRVLEASREIGNQRSCASALMNLGNLHRLGRRFGPAIANYAEALRLCAAHGFDAMRCPVLVALGTTYLDAGDLRAANEIGREALDAMATGQRQYEAMVHDLLARLAIESRDLAGARQRLARGMQVAIEREQILAQLAIVGTCGELLGAAGELQRAATLWSFAIGHAQSDALERQQLAVRLAALPLDEPARVAAAAAAAKLSLETVQAEVLAGDRLGAEGRSDASHGQCGAQVS